MTANLATWDDIPGELQEALLEELGYEIEEGKVLKDGEPVTDPWTEDELELENLAVLPGRSPPVLLDHNPVSIACYIEEYGNPFS